MQHRVLTAYPSISHSTEPIILQTFVAFLLSMNLETYVARSQAIIDMLLSPKSVKQIGEFWSHFKNLSHGPFILLSVPSFPTSASFSDCDPMWLSASCTTLRVKCDWLHSKFCVKPSDPIKMIFAAIFNDDEKHTVYWFDIQDKQLKRQLPTDEALQTVMDLPDFPPIRRWFDVREFEGKMILKAKAELRQAESLFNSEIYKFVELKDDDDA